MLGARRESLVIKWVRVGLPLPVQTALKCFKWGPLPLCSSISKRVSIKYEPVKCSKGRGMDVAESNKEWVTTGSVDSRFKFGRVPGGKDSGPWI